MIEFIIGGAVVGGAIVKAYEAVKKEALRASEPKLTYAEREENKRKEKETREEQEWLNRPILSDSAFESLKKQIEDYSKSGHTTYAFPSSLIESVLELKMRLSLKQINTLRPIMGTWCMYEGKEDKMRTEMAFLSMVKSQLTAKVEAKYCLYIAI